MMPCPASRGPYQSDLKTPGQLATWGHPFALTIHLLLLHQPLPQLSRVSDSVVGGRHQRYRRAKLVDGETAHSWVRQLEECHCDRGQVHTAK